MRDPGPNGFVEAWKGDGLGRLSAVYRDAQNGWVAESFGGCRMISKSDRADERKIKRLTREIDEIDRSFYGSSKEKNWSSFAGMLERKRDDIVRGIVLQLHTAIENLLTEELFAEILGTKHLQYKRKLRSTKGKALNRMLTGGGALGFEMKLNFAVVAELLDKKTKDQLSELNTLRNKCSHNWLLNVPGRRAGKGLPRQRLLNFRGRDLHRAEVLRDLYAEYGNIFYRMFARRLYRDDLIPPSPKRPAQSTPEEACQPR